LLGLSNALLWILWGERYALAHAKFSIRHVSPTYGVCFLVSMLFAVFLPAHFATFFVALLPMLSGGMLLLRRDLVKDMQYPRLLPRSTAHKGFKSILTVCLISFVTSVACYYILAIVPWEVMPSVEHSFSIGVIAGAAFVLLIAALALMFPERFNSFRVFNWLLVLSTLSGALFLTGEVFYFAAFILALMVVSVFEVLITMYFGILTLNGYSSPALAFGLAGGSIRLGIAIGNSWALVYERTSVWENFEGLIDYTVLFFVVLVVALLILLVRQEYSITAATGVPQAPSELKITCEQITQEYSLSSREAEILSLVARGFNTTSVAEALVISTNTVNTHIQHIYEKMGIHKRSELFKYINRYNTDKR